MDNLLFSHQVVSDSLVTPWTEAGQAPLSIGFHRQEYWSELMFLTLRKLHVDQTHIFFASCTCILYY